MRVWISKYALTQGIFEVEAESCERFGYPDMIQTRGKGLPAHYHDEGREWHKTPEEAIERAEVMRDNKIKSIKKRLAQLEAKSFAPEVKHD